MKNKTKLSDNNKNLLFMWIINSIAKKYHRIIFTIQIVPEETIQLCR